MLDDVNYICIVSWRIGPMRAVCPLPHQSLVMCLKLWMFSLPSSSNSK